MVMLIAPQYLLSERSGRSFALMPSPVKFSGHLPLNRSFAEAYRCECRSLMPDGQSISLGSLLGRPEECVGLQQDVKCQGHNRVCWLIRAGAIVSRASSPITMAPYFRHRPLARNDGRSAPRKPSLSWVIARYAS
jgi:hypothetical protein